jgi:inorganic pyrophosphatase
VQLASLLLARGLVQGDCDPLDVVEISGSPMQSGGVYHVKFLGAYAMIDGGELDWKIICINVDSPLAANLDSIQDLER